VEEAVEEGGGDGGVAEDVAPGIWNWLMFPDRHLGCELGF
jgi:hypothetical protein